MNNDDTALPTSNATIEDEHGREWGLLFFPDHADLVDLETGIVHDRKPAPENSLIDVFVRDGKLVYREPLPPPMSQEDIMDKMRAAARSLADPGISIKVTGTRMPCCRGQCNCHRLGAPCIICAGHIAEFIERRFPQ